MPAIKIGSKGVLGTHKIVRVASCGGIADLCHFFDGFHAFWNDMRGNLDVKDKVSILKCNMLDRSPFHELFPSYGVACGHGGTHRGSEIWGRGVIRLIRKWGWCRFILIVRVEMSLRVDGMVRLCLPVVVVVVIMGMTGSGRRGVIWNERICWWLVIERIVWGVVGHGLKGEDWLCSTEGEKVVVDGE